jgi:hypothetical protein
MKITMMAPSVCPSKYQNASNRWARTTLISASQRDLALFVHCSTEYLYFGSLRPFKRKGRWRRRSCFRESARSNSLWQFKITLLCKTQVATLASAHKYHQLGSGARLRGSYGTACTRRFQLARASAGQLYFFGVRRPGP